MRTILVQWITVVRIAIGDLTKIMLCYSTILTFSRVRAESEHRRLHPAASRAAEGAKASKQKAPGSENEKTVLRADIHRAECSSFARATQLDSMPSSSRMRAIL